MRQPNLSHLVVVLLLFSQVSLSFAGLPSRGLTTTDTSSIEELDQTLSETNTNLKDMGKKIDKIEQDMSRMVEEWDESNRLFNETAPQFLQEWQESNAYFGIFLNTTIPTLFRTWNETNDKFDALLNASRRIENEWVQTNSYLAFATHPAAFLLYGAALTVGALVTVGLVKLTIAKCKWPPRWPTCPKFRRPPTLPVTTELQTAV